LKASDCQYETPGALFSRTAFLFRAKGLEFRKAGLEICGVVALAIAGGSMRRLA
jgi:hypothetical protein